MPLLFKLALRNLTRNRMRTFLNLTMVIGAFCSIVIFKGFSNFMLFAVEDGMTNGQLGHIQVATTSMWAGDSLKKKEDGYIANPDQLEKNIAQLPRVKQVSGRAFVPVLLSNSDKTVGAVAIGYNPNIEGNIQKSLFMQEGEGFSKKQDYEIIVGAGIQNNLHLKMGQTVSVVSQSLAGSMSSVELEMRGVFKTGFADIDASTVYITLKAAQKLLDTNRVERLAILLKSGDHLEEAVQQVQGVLKTDQNLIAKDWKQSALLFRQVTDFYAIQNLVVEVILSVLVFFGILNTIGMSIYERIGEIGTMRALGDQRSDVLSLLLFEGLMLGVIGAVIGIPLAMGFSSLFSSLGVELVMPGASLPIVIEIRPVTKDFIEAACAVVVTCFISSLWPSLKAIRLTIVDALRANS